MVPLDSAVVSFYELLIVTMSLSAAFWPRFAKHKNLGALLEIHVISPIMQVSKKNYVHICWPSGPGRYDWLPLATAGLDSKVTTAF